MISASLNTADGFNGTDFAETEILSRLSMQQQGTYVVKILVITFIFKRTYVLWRSSSLHLYLMSSFLSSSFSSTSSIYSPTSFVSTFSFFLPLFLQPLPLLFPLSISFYLDIFPFLFLPLFRLPLYPSSSISIFSSSISFSFLHFLLSSFSSSSSSSLSSSSTYDPCN